MDQIKMKILNYFKYLILPREPKFKKRDRKCEQKIYFKNVTSLSD
jgi:hypothetical protein